MTTMKTSIILLLVCTVGLIQIIDGSGIQEEIYHGYTARKGEFPYQALLFNSFVNKPSTFCGGSLISSYYVLTAAHCSYQTSATRVYLGLTDTSDGDGAYYYDVSASDTYVNPSYNPNSYQNDLSILRLPAPARLGSLITIINLPKRDWAPPTTFDGYTVTASGWGQTYDGEEGVHRFLQYRSINKMPQNSCANYMARLGNVPPVTNGMICTDKQVVYAGPCHGDSGGPLTVSLSTGLYLIGAVSWGVGDCSSQNPVVYSNVAAYLNWINYVTGIPIS